MSRHYVPTAVSSPRLLTCAIGVALSATSAAPLAYAAEAAPAAEGAAE